MIKLLQTCVVSALSSFLGLLIVLAVGMVWWEVARGLPGVFSGAALSGGIALMFRKRMQVVASVIASGIGGAVACFLAISTAELLPPSTAEWALKGGAYGAAVGIPISLVMGFLGLLESRSHRVQQEGQA